MAQVDDSGVAKYINNVRDNEYLSTQLLVIYVQEFSVLHWRSVYVYIKYRTFLKHLVNRELFEH